MVPTSCSSTLALSPVPAGDTPDKGRVDEQQLRADTPDSEGGGYFTLSESETGSNNGTDSKDESVSNVNTNPKKLSHNGIHVQRHTSQDRSGSETPPRPSLPRNYRKETTPPRPSPPTIRNSSALNNRKSLTDEPIPLRPPPPLSYTSTLPPRAPKKLKNNNFCSKTLPTRKHSLQKEKPLQIVQPLQLDTANPVVSDGKQNTSNGHGVPSLSSDRCQPFSTPAQASEQENAQPVQMIKHKGTRASIMRLKRQKIIC